MKSYEIDAVRSALAEMPELHPLLFGTGVGDEPLGLFNHPTPIEVLRAGLRWGSCEVPDPARARFETWWAAIRTIIEQDEKASQESIAWLAFSTAVLIEESVRK